jgi:hypothetical protein
MMAVIRFSIRRRIVLNEQAQARLIQCIGELCDLVPAARAAERSALEDRLLEILAKGISLRLSKPPTNADPSDNPAQPPA